MKQLDTTLGQLAVDLLWIKTENDLTFSDKAKREAVMDAIDLLDKMMDRLHDAGLAS